MTVKQIVHMTAEQFRNASVEERLEALGEMTERFMFQEEWLSKHESLGRNNWEYKMHKKFRDNDRKKICEWLEGMGIETIAE